MKRALGLATALVVGLAGTCLAGAMYQNTSGAVARAVRIAFSEPAEITSMWPSFPQRDPQGPATVIVLSGGEIAAGGWFSFTWRPDSARVVKVEWMVQAPVKFSVEESEPLPDLVTQFHVHLSSEDGSQTLSGTITRFVSNERIPFYVRYTVDLGDMTGLDLTWDCQKDNHTPVVLDGDWAGDWCPAECVAEYIDTTARYLRVPHLAPNSAEFVLFTNFPTYIFHLTVVDGDGHEYVWGDADVDIPLHNLTPITLDATRFLPPEEVSRVTWRASNYDPRDVATFPIANPGSAVTTLKSQWPNVLNVTATVERTSGEVSEYTVEALVYFRDGTPFPIRGTAVGYWIDYTYRDFEIGMDEMFPTLDRLGLNAFVTACNWLFEPPNPSGSFTLQPIPRGSTHPLLQRVLAEGGALTTPDHILRELLCRASKLGVTAIVQLLQYPLPWTPDEYAYGNRRVTVGFFYGDGHAYENQLLHYRDMFIETGVDIVVLGAETDDVEALGGSMTRTFYSQVMAAYKAMGYAGAFTYAINYIFAPYNLRPEPFEPGHLTRPDSMGIPFGEMDYVGLTFYPRLATNTDPSIEEMFLEALRQAEIYLIPLSRVYGKPLLIEDFYGYAWDGMAINPLRDSGTYDPEEQLRWSTAWLRALSQLNRPGERPLIAGVSFGEYWLGPQRYVAAACRPSDPGYASQASRLTKSYINTGAHRPDRQKMVMVYFRDVPIR